MSQYPDQVSPYNSQKSKSDYSEVGKLLFKRILGVICNLDYSFVYILSAAVVNYNIDAADMICQVSVHNYYQPTSLSPKPLYVSDLVLQSY